MAGRMGAARITAGSLDLASTIRGWELHLRAGGRSPATLDKYLRSSRQFVAFLEARGMPATTAGLAREHVEAWIAELLEQKAPATAMARYQALRQRFLWLGEEGEMTDSPMAKMKGPIVPCAGLTRWNSIRPGTNGSSHPAGTVALRYLAPSRAAPQTRPGPARPALSGDNLRS